MSGIPSHNDQHGHEGASDEIAFGKVITIGVVSLAIFALSTVWAAWILSHETKKTEEATGATHRPPRVEREEIGIIDQVPFSSDTRLHRWRAEHDGRLNGYGWIDREKGLAHMPIEQAIDKIAGGALPAGAPAGAAPTPGTTTNAPAGKDEVAPAGLQETPPEHGDHPGTEGAPR
ncbi:MAG TPA: hypothetical protein VIF57_08665 [Polyangia bacterium]|jgi:hypothetical protein